MSGSFLNLGGNAGAMSRSTPARVLDTTFQPNAARPVLVMYSIRIILVAATDRAQARILSDKGSPPTTVVSRFGGGIGSIAEVYEGVLVALVLPGDNVRIETQIVAGAPAVQLIAQSEVVL